MNDHELIERLAGTDDYPANRPLADDWLAVVDRTVDRGVGADEVKGSDAGSSAVDRRVAVDDGPGRGWNRGPSAWIAGATAALVIVAGAATFLLRDEPFTADAAATVADEYIATFNDGDTDAVMALFASDVDITFAGYTGQKPVELERSAFEALVSWWQAQGTTLTAPDCAVTGEAPGVWATVVCGYLTIDAPTKAVGATPFPSTTTMEITRNGIRSFHQAVGQPDLYGVEAPFERWMQEHHFVDREMVYFFTLTTTDEGQTFVPTTRSRTEATELGRGRAAFASEWADYLGANNCDYLDLIC